MDPPSLGPTKAETRLIITRTTKSSSNVKPGGEQIRIIFANCSRLDGHTDLLAFTPDILPVDNIFIFILAPGGAIGPRKR